jgi:hypothetical protein
MLDVRCAFLLRIANKHKCPHRPLEAISGQLVLASIGGETCRLSPSGYRRVSVHGRKDRQLQPLDFEKAAPIAAMLTQAEISLRTAGADGSRADAFMRRLSSPHTTVLATYKQFLAELTGVEVEGDTGSEQ